MDEAEKSFSIGLLYGSLLGGLIGLTIGTTCLRDHSSGKARVFHQENEPTVIRVYTHGVDMVYVESGIIEYITLDSHLDAFKDDDLRNLEEAKILDRVGWYKE